MWCPWRDPANRPHPPAPPPGPRPPSPPVCRPPPPLWPPRSFGGGWRRGLAGPEPAAGRGAGATGGRKCGAPGAIRQTGLPPPAGLLDLGPRRLVVDGRRVGLLGGGF